MKSFVVIMLPPLNDSGSRGRRIFSICMYCNRIFCASRSSSASRRSGSSLSALSSSSSVEGGRGCLSCCCSSRNCSQSASISARCSALLVAFDLMDSTRLEAGEPRALATPMVDPLFSGQGRETGEALAWRWRGARDKCSSYAAGRRRYDGAALATRQTSVPLA
nr:hypothetical protein CFP56_25971 [Quercus suber]